MAVYEMSMGGCGPCVCKKCLLWWSGRCPRGGCWDEWRAAHEPWPGPVRRQWTDWDRPGEQAHWCRGGACYAARACPDYIEYEADKTIVQDCLEGAVVKYQDGYIQCSMIEVMGCEECYRRFEERIEGDEIGMIESKNTNELQGQYELSDLLPKDEETGMPEGYDEEGRLLNVDGLQVTENHGGPGAAATGETDAASIVAAAPAPPSVPITPQTSADAGKLPYAKPEILSGPPQTSAQDEARLAALATEINTITEQARGAVISAALAVGKRLIEARSLCPEGRFGEWLAASVSYSERKAQDMMRLYVEYGRDGSIPDSIAALDYSKAVALLSAPAEQRDALAAQAAEEGLSVRQLQQEIKRLNAEKLKAQMQIDNFIDQTDRLREEIAHLDDREQEYDRAIVERDDKLKAAQAAIEREREAAALANAKAAAAEASAEELRKLHSDAEDRAAQSAQRASDALDRARQVAKDLAEARAKIQALSEAAAAAVPEPEVRTVEVVPEAMTRELEQLRRELAEVRAVGGTTSSGSGKPLPPSPEGEGSGASAAEKFRWFYQNQMQPTFKTALNLLKEVALEDGKAADAFATAITNACKVLMNQIGTKEE